MDARRKIQLPREQLLRLYGPSAADGRQPVAAAAAAALAAQPATAGAAQPALAAAIVTQPAAIEHGPVR